MIRFRLGYKIYAASKIKDDYLSMEYGVNDKCNTQNLSIIFVAILMYFDYLYL